MSLYCIGNLFGGIGTGTGIGHSHEVAEPKLHSALPSLVFILQHVNYHRVNLLTLWYMSLYGIRNFFGGIGTGTGIGHSHEVASPSCTQHRPHWSLYYNMSIITKTEFTNFMIHVTVWHQKFFRWHRHRHWHWPQPPGCRAWAALGIRLPILSCTQHHPH